MTTGKMASKEIQEMLADAYHAIGHAYAYLGSNRVVAASIEVDNARASMKLAKDALDKLLDSRQTA